MSNFFWDDVQLFLGWCPTFFGMMSNFFWDDVQLFLRNVQLFSTFTVSTYLSFKVSKYLIFPFSWIESNGKSTTVSELIPIEYIICKINASCNIFMSIKSAYAFITSAIVGALVVSLNLNSIVFAYSGLSFKNLLLYTRCKNPKIQLKCFKEFPFSFDFKVPPSFDKLNLEAKNGSKSAGSTPGE